MELNALKHQGEFLKSRAVHPCITGGLGSGKSEAGILRCIYLAFSAKESIKIAYYMPSYDLLKERVIPGFISKFDELGIKYKFNKSDFKITIYANTGIEIIFRSYSNPNRIISYEVAHSIVDELDTLEIDKASEIFRKITERNRATTIDNYNSIACVSTPDGGFNGFIYDFFVRNASSEKHLIKAKTADNPYLPPGYIENLRAIYDEKLLKLYLEGEFVNLNNNQVYYFYNQIKHYSDLNINDFSEVHIGIDFNIGGCVAIVMGLKGDVGYVIDEFVSFDTKEFINNLSRFKNATIYPDASGKHRNTNASLSDIELIKDAGFRVSVSNSNPPIRDRINTINNLFSKNRLFINSKICKKLNEALLEQTYNDKGEPIKFSKHPSIDDYVDALGYMIYRLFFIKRPISYIKYQGF